MVSAVEPWPSTAAALRASVASGPAGDAVATTGSGWTPSVDAGVSVEDGVSGVAVSSLSSSLIPSLPALSTNFDSRSERESIVALVGADGTPSNGWAAGVGGSWDVSDSFAASFSGEATAASRSMAWVLKGIGDTEGAGAGGSVGIW